MDDVSVLRERAKKLALSGNWGDEAIDINTKMIELDDRAADAYTRLAKCFIEQGKKLAAFIIGDLRKKN
ncbi:MAG: hypothetical protein M0036_11535 [Desulfobacteraceae bacterium]|nr:hypothetical protein [Desulfobacteraceae bacterium]